MKNKILLTVLFICILIPFSAQAETIAEGSCRDNVTWALDSEGILTISGNGQLGSYMYADEQIPWDEYRENIKEIKIEDGVTSIGSYIFEYCSNVSKITIPSSVTSISHHIFYRCNNTIVVEFMGDSPRIDDVWVDSSTNTKAIVWYHIGAYGWTSDTWKGYSIVCIDSPISSDYSILNDENRNGQGILFTLNETSKTAIVGDGSNNSNNSGYLGLGNFDVVIPNEVVKDEIVYKVNGIGANAFYRNPAIKSIKLGKNVSSIGAKAFSSCPMLTEFLIDEDSKFFSVDDGILYDNAKLQLYSYPAGKDLTEFTVPETVKTINQYAFGGAKNLKSVTVKDNVTAIQDYAFYECTNITEIILPFIGNNSNSSRRFEYIFEITGYDGFTKSDVYKLEKITITGGRLPSNAFNGWRNVKEIHLPIYEELTVIPYGCFSNCTSLDKLTFGNKNDGLPIGSILLPDGIISIEGNEWSSQPGAFNGCKSLRRIEFPSSLQSIYSWAFASSGIEEVNIPVSVKSIGSYAFINCQNLQAFSVDEGNANFSSDKWGALFDKDKTRLMYYPTAREFPYYNVPDTVTSIDGNAFYNCDTLVNLYIPQTVTKFNGSVISGCDNVTVCCWLGSAADTYASSNNITSWYMDNYTMQGIDIYQLPEQYEQSANAMNWDGLYVVANYGGRELQLDDYSLSFDRTKVGKQMVTVKSGNFTTEFEINLIKAGASGDVNNDTKVNILDVTRLLNHVNKSNALQDDSACDINGDGKINILDVTRLLNSVNKSDPLE